MLKDHHSSVSRSRRNRCLSDGDSAGRFRAIAAVHIRLRCHDRTQVFRNNFCWRQLVWIKPLRKARDNLEQELSDDLLGAEHGMGFAPMIPARDAHFGIRGKDPVRGQLMRPHQKGRIELLIVRSAGGWHGFRR